MYTVPRVMHFSPFIIQAIEFAMEEGDDDLWDVLIRLSIMNPSKYITDTFM